jgi:hypothetical protein
MNRILPLTLFLASFAAVSSLTTGMGSAQPVDRLSLEPAFAEGESTLCLVPAEVATVAVRLEHPNAPVCPAGVVVRYECNAFDGAFQCVEAGTLVFDSSGCTTEVSPSTRSRLKRRLPY